MEFFRLISCLLVTALLPGLSILGGEIPLDKVERVRTDMALLGAAMGMGTAITVSFGLLPLGTPLSDSLLVAIPELPRPLSAVRLSAEESLRWPSRFNPRLSSPPSSAPAWGCWEEP